MPDVSVRPALPQDADRIGMIHAATMRQATEAGLHGSLPPGVAAAFHQDHFVRLWRQAITAPPTPLHRVLTALEGNTVVGFAALAPAEPLPGAPDEVARAAEVIALEVEVARRGHGSRLLAAAADVARAQPASPVLAWGGRGGGARARFLSGAGFAPLGARRAFDVGGAELVQVAWWATLS